MNLGWIVALALLGSEGDPQDAIVPARVASPLAEAERAAAWLEQVSVATDLGRVWPADPLLGRSSSSDLYSGGAGVVWFLLALSQESGNPRWLTQACQGADFLIASMQRPLTASRCGLYTGAAGVASVLLEVARVSGDSAWATHARRGAVSIRASGAPRIRSEGLWQNVGICCGDAGLAAFFLELHSLDPRDEGVGVRGEVHGEMEKTGDLAYAERVAAAIVAKAKVIGEVFERAAILCAIHDKPELQPVSVKPNKFIPDDSPPPPIAGDLESALELDLHLAL